MLWHCWLAHLTSVKTLSRSVPAQAWMSPQGEEFYLNFLLTFYFTRHHQYSQILRRPLFSHHSPASLSQWAPSPSPFLCDHSFTPTYKALHYQLGPFSHDGTLLPWWGPPPVWGFRGGVCWICPWYDQCVWWDIRLSDIQTILAHVQVSARASAGVPDQTLCTNFFCLGSVSAPIGRWQPVGGTKNTNIYVWSSSILYIWSSELRDPSISLDCFRHSLKTYLYKR